MRTVANPQSHIVVDTLELLPLAVVHGTSLQDQAGGQLLLQGLFDQIKHNVQSRWCRWLKFKGK